MRKSDLVCAILCAVWITAVGIVAAAASEPLLAAMRSSNAADWAAAFASVIAVAAALGIAATESVRTNRIERRRRAEVVRDAVNQAFSAIDTVHMYLGVTAQATKKDLNEVNLGLARSDLEHARMLVQSVDRSALPARRYAIVLMNVQSQAGSALVIIDGLLMFVQQGTAWPEDALDSTLGHVEHAVQLVKRWAAEDGVDLE